MRSTRPGSDTETDDASTDAINPSSKYPWERVKRRTAAKLDGFKGKMTQLSIRVVLAMLLTREDKMQLCEVYVFFERHKDQLWTIMKEAWLTIRKSQTRIDRDQIARVPDNVEARMASTTLAAFNTTRG